MRSLSVRLLASPPPVLGQMNSTVTTFCGDEVSDAESDVAEDGRDPLTVFLQIKCKKRQSLPIEGFLGRCDALHLHQIRASLVTILQT